MFWGGELFLKYSGEFPHVLRPRASPKRQASVSKVVWGRHLRYLRQVPCGPSPGWCGDKLHLYVSPKKMAVLWGGALPFDPNQPLDNRPFATPFWQQRVLNKEMYIFKGGIIQKTQVLGGFQTLHLFFVFVPAVSLIIPAIFLQSMQYNGFLNTFSARCLFVHTSKCGLIMLQFVM